MRIKPTFWGVGISGAMAAMIVIGSQSQPLRAQVVERTTTHAERQMANLKTLAHKTCKASELIGMKVRGINGEDNIGSINDLVLGHDGRVKYAAVSFGGFLGMGDKLFAVPFEAIDFVKTDDDAFARIDVTEETLKEKKGFNQENWPADADSTFTRGNLRRQAAVSNVAR
jgi:sporulation protein YlmC with PRC-barrel domain